MGDRRVEKLTVKFDFRGSWRRFPLLPQTMLIFLFIRQHRLQRLRDIELGAGSTRKLTLDAK